MLAKLTRLQIPSINHCERYNISIYDSGVNDYYSRQSQSYVWCVLVYGVCVWVGLHVFYHVDSVPETHMYNII